MALALDESVKDDDQLLEWDGVTIVFDNKVAPHLSDKIIDFHNDPQGGFSIKKEGPGGSCGSCC